jgi:uncharacterized protein
VLPHSYNIIRNIKPRNINFAAMSKTFLTAEWRKLAMANYAVDKKLLLPFLPYKTELDLFNNTCYVSLVGFMFLNTRVLGCKIPFHINFEEVNLRFYVRYNDAGEWKRGTVFISEIVPKPAIALVANNIYKEHYQALPMHHSWETKEEALVVNYGWKKKNWNSFQVTAEKEPVAITIGSEAEFITEHYWGYTKQGEKKTAEYGVEHPRWDIFPVKEYAIDVDFAALYGNEFHFLSTATPQSVLLAEGSEVVVRKGRRI